MTNSQTPAVVVARTRQADRRLRPSCTGCGRKSGTFNDQGLGRATLAAWESNHGPVCRPLSPDEAVLARLRADGVPGTARLGDMQALALYSVGRSPYPGGGWNLGSPSQTERVLDSLAKRGLVNREDAEVCPATNGRPARTQATYTATAAVTAAARVETDRTRRHRILR